MSHAAAPGEGRGRDGDRHGDRHESSGAKPDPGEGGGAPEMTEEESRSAARLFDVRRIIGGLFTVYGVILTITGIADGSGASRKAQGIDINLWSGIAMLVVGLLFLLWMRVSPNEAPDPTTVDTDRPASH